MSRAYRTSSDAPGTLPNVAIVKTSGVPYTSSSERWGDYSAVSLDPNDNATFWYYHEYAATSSSWNTWISYRRVQGPTLTADQATISSMTGGTVTFTLDNPSHANKRYYLLATA